MSQNDKNITRRGFIAGAGLTGVGSMLALATGTSQNAQAAAGQTQAGLVPGAGKIPRRVLGKTKQSISILSFGTMFDIPGNQIMLKKCLDWGLTSWDTADCYEGGNSEIGIGMFFEKFPETRKQVFLVSKSDKRDPKGMTQLLNRSLERMKTDYIDGYYIHGASNTKELSPEVKAWAEKAKKDGKIRFFGFSTHGNMENMMLEAAKVGWIDVVMMAFNYRLMQRDAMRQAVDACTKAGVGLIAMKTQGGGSVKTDSEAELKLAGHFVEKGYTPQQAKIKAVWGNEAISCVCSQMPNLTILSANTAAAMDKTKLTAADFDILKKHAAITSASYCAGCREICEARGGGNTRIADIMRYMMYHTSYGDTHRARQLYAELPPEVRDAVAIADYTEAERVCPQGLAIGDIMREAKTQLG